MTLGDLLRLLHVHVPIVFLIAHRAHQVFDCLPVSFVLGDGVHFEVALEGSAVRAVEAVEGLLPRVYPEVGLQVGAVAELPPAEVADIIPREFV